MTAVQYTERFDSARFLAGDDVSEWYGQVRVFVKIKDYSGVLVRWYDMTDTAQSSSYSHLKPLQWWTHPQSGKIRYTVTSIKSIEKRAHVVPDFSYIYKYKRSNKVATVPLKSEKFLLNDYYIIQ